MVSREWALDGVEGGCGGCVAVHGAHELCPFFGGGAGFHIFHLFGAFWHVVRCARGWVCGAIFGMCVRVCARVCVGTRVFITRVRVYWCTATACVCMGTSVVVTWVRVCACAAMCTYGTVGDCLHVRVYECVWGAPDYFRAPACVYLRIY